MTDRLTDQELAEVKAQAEIQAQSRPIGGPQELDKRQLVINALVEAELCGRKPTAAQRSEIFSAYRGTIGVPRRLPVGGAFRV